jgi:predicted RNA-binding protein with RPS1 domain
MTTPMRIGEVIAVSVTKVLPFGVLVETPAGVPGLVRPATAEVGQVVNVRVAALDGQRFSAKLA